MPLTQVYKGCHHAFCDGREVVERFRKCLGAAAPPAVYFAKTLNDFPSLRVAWHLYSGRVVKVHDLVRTLLSYRTRPVPTPYRIAP